MMDTMDYDTELKDNIEDYSSIALRSKIPELHHIYISTPNQGKEF